MSSQRQHEMLNRVSNVFDAIYDVTSWTSRLKKAIFLFAKSELRTFRCEHAVVTSLAGEVRQDIARS
jgi:hypothetical protein